MSTYSQPMSGEPMSGEPMSGQPLSGPDLGRIPGMLAKAAWQFQVTAGVAAVVVGVLVLVWPGETLLVAGVLFGIYLLVSGAFQLAGAFGRHVPGSMRALGFISGTLSIMLGLISFRGPLQSILLLAIWIGFGWLLHGISQITMAISFDGLPARGWQIFFGALTVLAGIVVIAAPFSSLGALTVVTGIWLVVIGVVEVVHGIQLRRAVGQLT